MDLLVDLGAPMAASRIVEVWFYKSRVGSMGSRHPVFFSSPELFPLHTNLNERSRATETQFGRSESFNESPLQCANLTAFFV